MQARNHVTVLKPADAVAKGTNEAEQRATGEVNVPDPQDAKEVIQKNTGKKILVGPNTKLDREELEGPTGEEADQQRQEQEQNQKAAEETSLKPGDVVDLEKSKEEGQRQTQQQHKSPPPQQKKH